MLPGKSTDSKHDWDYPLSDLSSSSSPKLNQSAGTICRRCNTTLCAECLKPLPFKKSKLFLKYSPSLPEHHALKDLCDALRLIFVWSERDLALFITRGEFYRRLSAPTAINSVGGELTDLQELHRLVHLSFTEPFTQLVKEPRLKLAVEKGVRCELSDIEISAFVALVHSSRGSGVLQHIYHKISLSNRHLLLKYFHTFTMGMSTHQVQLGCSCDMRPYLIRHMKPSSFEKFNFLLKHPITRSPCFQEIVEGLEYDPLTARLIHGEPICWSVYAEEKIKGIEEPEMDVLTRRGCARDCEDGEEVMAFSMKHATKCLQKLNIVQNISSIKINDNTLKDFIIYEPSKGFVPRTPRTASELVSDLQLSESFYDDLTRDHQLFNIYRCHPFDDSKRTRLYCKTVPRSKWFDSFDLVINSAGEFAHDSDNHAMEHLIVASLTKRSEIDYNLQEIVPDLYAMLDASSSSLNVMHVEDLMKDSGTKTHFAFMMTHFGECIFYSTSFFKKGVVPVDERYFQTRLSFMQHSAELLLVLHRVGFAHLDFTLENIVYFDERPDCVRLIDFGKAVPTGTLNLWKYPRDNAKGNDSVLSRYLSCEPSIGKTGYMPPECSRIVQLLKDCRMKGSVEDWMNNNGFNLQERSLFLFDVQKADSYLLGCVLFNLAVDHCYENPNKRPDEWGPLPPSYAIQEMGLYNACKVYNAPFSGKFLKILIGATNPCPMRRWSVRRIESEMKKLTHYIERESDFSCLQVDDDMYWTVGSSQMVLPLLGSEIFKEQLIMRFNP